MALAKMDATPTTIPNPKITVRGYPTLYFLTAKGDGALRGGEVVVRGASTGGHEGRRPGSFTRGRQEGGCRSFCRAACATGRAVVACTWCVRAHGVRADPQTSPLRCAALPQWSSTAATAARRTW